MPVTTPAPAATWGAGAAAAVTAAVTVLLGVPLLGVALGVAVLLAVVVWDRPQRGVLLLAALLPFDGLLLVLPLPAQAVAWKEVLLGVTLALALRPRHGPYHRPPVLAVPLALLATVAVVSAAFVPPLQAAVGLKVLLFGALTLVLLWRCPFDARDRDRLVSVLAAVGAVVAVIGLGQQVVGDVRLNELGYAYNSTIRFTGGAMRSWSTFNQPFPFAFFLMLVVLVAGSVALSDPVRTRNRLVLLAMPLYLAGMAVAVVRTAWIGVVAGIAYLAWSRHRSLLAGLPLALGALALAAALGVTGFFASNSVDERFGRWGQLPAVVEQSPFGEGVGSAGAAAAKAEQLAGGAATFDPDAAGSERVVFQPDNSYLKVLYELGVPGLGVFVLLLVVAFASTRRRERDPGVGPLATGASALVVAGAVASTASTLFEIFPFDYHFWIVVGVVVLSSSERRWPGTANDGARGDGRSVTDAPAG